MSDSKKTKIRIPPEVAKFVDKDAPKSAKIMAARGLVPMAPPVLITVLFMLSRDSIEEVAKAAELSLETQPANVIASVLEQPVHPKILDFYSRKKITDATILEKILINRVVSDATLLFLAPQVEENLVTIIANNQNRLLQNPDIAEAIRDNPATPKAVVDRMVSFLRLNGVVLKGVSEELTADEVKSILAQDDDDILAAIYDENVDDDLATLSATLLDEDEDEDKEVEEDLNLTRRLKSMNISDKIKLALKGNKEARMTLVKEPNKLISTAVIKNPRIKVNEVVSVAQMRSVGDEVLRLIALKSEWTKLYPVKLALVNNPKCPLPVAMNFMKHLRMNELVGLTKNKNVSQNVQRHAKRLVNQKRGIKE
jgi:hypothetical protein